LFTLGSFWKLQQQPTFFATFIHGYGYALILTNNGLGYSLGAFFTVSSGHPGWDEDMGSDKFVSL
jgi:hypothetical protein